MAQCPGCGNRTADGLTFCPKCGRPLQAAPEPSVAPPAEPAPVPPAPAVPAAPPAPPATPQQRPDASDTPVPPAGAGPAAAPKKRNTAVIIVIIAALLGCCCLAASGGGYWWWSRQSPSDPAADGPDKPAETTSTPPSTDTADGPADTVEAFYLALDTADIDGIKATFVESAAKDITPDWFEGVYEVDYEVVDTQIDGQKATVTVRESAGMVGGDQDVVYGLVLKDGEWRISEWVIGDAGDLEGSAGAGTGASAAGMGALGPETATDAVGEMLVALKSGDAAAARSKATKRFLQDDPGFFSDTAGAFIDFDVIDVFQDAAVYVVVVEEQWNSGPEETSYTVVEENGKVLVDSVLWMGE